ncbi:hypothetical protein BD414DRAFT_421592 [Trametes punicea]|nr:hypothetical protein BD414DRAFT_421592 [Trametes punicea]
MPLRGASGAPSFDPAHPHTLLDFFEELGYMLDEANVEDDQKRKEYAVRYAPGQHKLLWRGFTSFAEGEPYEDFKKEVIKEYLGDDGKRLYSLGDLKILVSDAAKAGFRSSSEFKTYSRNFRIVADYLVKHSVLRNEERDRLFIKGLPEQLQRAVLDRLKVKCPDVLAPREPYSVTQVTEAAEFVLDAQDDDAPTERATTRTADAVSPQVKTEVSELADAFKTTLVALLQQQRSSSASPIRQGPPHMDASTPRAGQCHYCGDSAHIIRRCPQVDTDAAAGLVKRNEQGQVVLASGSYVPSAIAGSTLRERVQEYYRQNPEARPPQLVQQLLYEPVSVLPPPSPRAGTQYMAATDHPRPTEARAERARRRSVRFDEPPENRIQLPTSARIEEVPDEPTVRTQNTPAVEDAPKDASKRVHVTVSPTKASTPAVPPPIVEHPFRNIRDATYAPPSQRNYGLPPATPSKATATPPKKNEAAYRSFVPVYDPKHAINVFRRCLETPTSLTLEELLALSPEIRSATREVCSMRRVAVEGQEGGEGTDRRRLGTRRTTTFLADMPEAFAQAAQAESLRQVETPPPGALVIGDPVDNFLKTCGPGEALPPLVTSVDSLAIRAIEGTFQDSRQEPVRVSCILDSGSAITSMSDGLAHTLGLAFDPKVILHMQSANGETNPSLGLARNVPVRFGDIVVYLQFHVISSPAYDVILGRPFDVLTESVVQTFGDGTQTITLHDPNSSIITKVPTLPRRPPQFARPSRPRIEDFRLSRA